MAQIQREANFLDPPHEVLYPCVWGPDEQMLPQARSIFISTIMGMVTERWGMDRSWIRFSVIGSGASYNWDETGDIDIQVWVSDESRLVDIRRFIVANLLHRTCADYGLATPDCAGAMEVQFYAKAGRGTPTENLAGQPYACYDIDLDRWLVRPIPLTPELYGDLFLLVEDRAEQIATEAEDAIAAVDRARLDVGFWAGLASESEIFSGRHEVAERNLVRRLGEAKALFDQIFKGRQEAYSPEGHGIYDERDAIWKLLEVWGITPRLKEIAHSKPR